MDKKNTSNFTNAELPVGDSDNRTATDENGLTPASGDPVEAKAQRPFQPARTSNPVPGMIALGFLAYLFFRRA